jgi:hypothetical protein
MTYQWPIDPQDALPQHPDQGAARRNGSPRGKAVAPVVVCG